MSSFKKNSIAFYDFIESKNSHGKVQLLAQMAILGLHKSKLARDIRDGEKTNFGKNQLKDLWLKSFIISL